jgi:hypothetical protein
MLFAKSAERCLPLALKQVHSLFAMDRPPRFTKAAGSHRLLVAGHRRLRSIWAAESVEVQTSVCRAISRASSVSTPGWTPPRDWVAHSRSRLVHTVDMRSMPWSRPAFSVAVISLIMFSLSAHAQAPTGKPDTAGAAAAEACERAARQTLTGKALHSVEVTFNAAPTVEPNLSSDSQIVLRGVARWRGASGIRSFNYSCTMDLRTSEAVGLVMRDSTPVAAEAAPARAPAEPDLSELSPAACESSAVEALKQRWPRISQISFDSATRSFRQQSTSRAELHGSGLAVPAPRSPFTLFEFDCEIDPRDGRVLRTSLSG